MKGTFVILLRTGMLWAAQDPSKQAAPKPWDKFLGTWKQVPSEDSSLLEVEPESGGIKFSFGCKRDGLCSDVDLVHYDGRLWSAKNQKISTQLQCNNVPHAQCRRHGFLRTTAEKIGMGFGLPARPVGQLGQLIQFRKTS